jgi:hypothetical protein
MPAGRRHPGGATSGTHPQITFLVLATRRGAGRSRFCLCEAIIVLYHTTGYLSLVSKYEFAKHRRKQEIVEKVLPAGVLTTLRDRTEHVTFRS